jgi:hypothetical protein
MYKNRRTRITIGDNRMVEGIIFNFLVDLEKLIPDKFLVFFYVIAKSYFVLFISFPFYSFWESLYKRLINLYVFSIYE